MHTLIQKIRKYFSRYMLYKYYYNKYSKYEYLSEKYKNLHAYENILEKNSNTTLNRHTKQFITFHKKLTFNDSKSKTKKILGNPIYQITNTKNENIEVYFYKILIGKQKIRCEVHFYKDNLILFTYHLPYIKNEETKMMFSFLYEKYGLSEHDPFPIKIKDHKDKTLIISKHIGVNLMYVDCNHFFFEQLKDSLRKKEYHKMQYDIKLKKFYSSL